MAAPYQFCAECGGPLEKIRGEIYACQWRLASSEVIGWCSPDCLDLTVKRARDGKLLGKGESRK